MLGSFKPGKYADIIAVAGDPLQDISALETVRLVIKDGKIFKQRNPLPKFIIHITVWLHGDESAGMSWGSSGENEERSCAALRLTTLSASSAVNGVK